MEETKEYELIHAYVSDPADSIFKSARNDRARCHTIKCNNKDNCDLYARGECALLAAFKWHRCPYGKYTLEEGFTKKARKYHSWIQEKREKYKDVKKSLKTHNDMFAFIGDYVFLPYTFMDMCKDVPFLQHSQFMIKGCAFLKKEDFTIENIIKLIKFKPQAMMGGEIKDYQKIHMPKFALHLKEKLPEEFKIVHEKCEELADFKTTNIGRKALLVTMKPGSKFDKGWVWDGEHYTNDNAHPFAPISYESARVVLKPKPNTEVTITDESQVDENTKFLT